MKNLTLLIATVVMTAFYAVLWASPAEQDQGPQNELQVLCSPGLETMGADCIEAYSEKNEGVKISFIKPGDIKPDEASLNDYFKVPGRIAFLTSEHLNQLDSKDLRVLVIGREVFVPVMNPDNPFIGKISETGISPEEFAMAYAGEGRASWNAILGDEGNQGVNAYRITDASFEKYITGFLGTPANELGGKVLESCEEIMKAVSGDKYGMGFCKLSQLQEMENAQAELVSVIPVDINKNNRIDQFEQYYGSVDELARGVWIGKYPASLFSRIYAVYNQRLSGDEEVAFLKWMASGGQPLFNEHGFSALLANEQKSILAGLESQPESMAQADNGSSKSSLLLVILAFLFGGALLVYIVLRMFNVKKNEKEIVRLSPGAFKNDPAVVPGGYFFDKSHTWAFMERTGDVSIGIDDFIQHVTGKITRVELRQPGEKVKKGETIFSLIQQGKTLEIKSPVSGIIKSKNKNLSGNAGLLNTSPYGEGWLYLIEPLNWQVEMKSFLIRDKYTAWIKMEYSRLKDFMITALQPLAGKKIVLQDGGEVKEGMLEQLGPEAWEEFQTGFLKNK